MKKINSLLLFILALGVFASCDKEIESDLIKGIRDGDNVVTFNKRKLSFTGVADPSGPGVDFDVFVRLTGPSIDGVTGDLNVSFEGNTDGVSSGDEAQAGVHYTLGSDIVLKEDQGYLGQFKLKMLTKDLPSPLTKKFNLVVKDVNGNAIPGAPAQITFNYACPSELAGDYSVAITNSNGGSRNYDDTISKVGIGEYWTENVGTWAPGTIPGGLYFTDLCGEISIPAHNLGDYYSNQVYEFKKGFVKYVDPNATVKVVESITFYYTIEFSAGNTNYTAVYTKK